MKGGSWVDRSIRARKECREGKEEERVGAEFLKLAAGKNESSKWSES